VSILVVVISREKGGNLRRRGGASNTIEPPEGTLFRDRCAVEKSAR